MASSQALPPSMAAPTAAGGVGTPWWVALVAGIGMALVGLLMLLAPGISLVVAAQFLGFYWLVDGIVSLVSIFVDRRGWGWKLVIGILGIIAGISVLQHPLWSALLLPAVLVMYLGIMGIAIGIVEVVMAFRGAGWGTGILGAVNVIFGLMLVFNPVVGALTVPYILGGLLGGLGIVGGIGTAIMSFSMRSSNPA